MARYLAIALAFCATATAEEIPLKDIWALNMPGTCDVRELDCERSRALVGTIRESLHLPDASSLTKGFAVEGSGAVALQHAHDVLVSGEKPRYRFAPDSELSIVFFSREFGRNVHIREVALKDGTMEVRYQLVPHKTENTTAHFALIPIGKLPVGKHHVKMARMPLDQSYRDASYQPLSDSDTRRIVCQSFYLAIGNVRRD